MVGTQRMRVACVLVVAAAMGAESPAWGQGRDVPRPEVRGILKSVDVSGAKITLTLAQGRDTPATEKTFALAKEVEIAVGGFGSGRMAGVFKAGKLAELPEGIVVHLSLSADQKVVESILAEEPTVRGILKAVDAAKKTVTIDLVRTRESGGEDKSYVVSAEAEIAVDDGRGRRYSVKEAKLGDLKPGSTVTLRLSIDQKQVHSVLAEGPSLYGTIKAVDAGKKSVTLVTRPARGEEAGEEKTLLLADDAVVVLDNGKGRRLSLQVGKLADVPTGSVAQVRMTGDQAHVCQLRVEGPNLYGLLKGVDPKKSTISIAIPKGRAEAEEKTFTVARDARIFSEGKAVKLDDLKVGDNGPYIQLRLALDQKTVEVIHSQQPRARD